MLPKQPWFSWPIIGAKMETGSKMDIESFVYEKALCQVIVEDVKKVCIKHFNKCLIC